MSKLLWLIGGTTLALAVFTILNGPELASSSPDGVDRATGKVGAWGLKQRAAGTGGKLFGKAEELAGKATGDEETQSSGAFDQAAGAVRNAAGHAAEALSSTVHDLNKS